MANDLTWELVMFVEIGWDGHSSSISDDMLLVPVDPASDHGDKDLQDHGSSSGLTLSVGSDLSYTQSEEYQCSSVGQIFQHYGVERLGQGGTRHRPHSPCRWW